MKIPQKEISAEQHWEQFGEFCRWEKAAGGPDPHMILTGHLNRLEQLQEHRWRAGLYVAFYNAPTAEVVGQHWPLPVMTQEADDMVSWLELNWEGLSFRRERRAARTPARTALFLRDYLQWSQATLPALLSSNEVAMPEQLYEILWNSANAELHYAGRYACFKLLEYLRRYCAVPAQLPDIRPIGGSSPRYALSWLYPEWTPALRGGNSEVEIRATNQCVEWGIRELKERVGILADYYLFEVFLCDYRQSWEGRRQYPGRSQDSELEHLKKVKNFWRGRYEAHMLEGRSALFPHECLGEQMGWKGVRKELGHVLSTHGYTWSDLLYRYTETVSPMYPVRRNGAGR